MTLKKRIFTILTGVFVSLLLNSAATANNGWRTARTKNFELAGDASEKDLRDAATRFETLREAIRQTLKNVNLDSPVPLKIVVLKNEKLAENLQSANENYAADYLQNGEAAKYFVVYADEKASDYRRAFHDYAHFLINENLGRANVQPWLFEGLAANFETFQSASENPNAEYSSLLQQNKLIPLEAFFETDYYSLQKQENHGATLFYAEAWALTKYFLEADGGAKQAQLLKYIELVTKGKLAKESFADAFQIDYSTLEIELKKFIEQKNLAQNHVSFQDKIADDNFKTATISETESEIVAGDLFYQVGRYADAEKMFESALKSNPESSRASSSLGLVKLKQENFVAAEKYLERAVALDESDFLSFYRLAYFLSREGMTDYGFASNYTRPQALRMRELLDKAIQLNPNFPESYNLYAFINYVRSEAIEQANVFAEKARRLAPGNPRYQLRVAELAKLAEDFARARRLARRVYDTALDEQLRVYAKNTLYTIDTYESQMNGVRNARYRKVLSEVTDQPLTDEESARLNWLAMLEAINQNLRKSKSNEKRVLGFLTGISCGASGIEYSVKTDGRIIKLNSETFDSVMLMSYSQETSNKEIGCGTPKNPVFAVVNYRPSKTNAKSAGEIVSIEFVPQKFHFLY